eukprot:scaffold6274_cov132-Isochrysis_galbana.AAC.4
MMVNQGAIIAPLLIQDRTNLHAWLASRTAAAGEVHSCRVVSCDTIVSARSTAAASEVASESRSPPALPGPSSCMPFSTSPHARLRVMAAVRR